MRPTEGVSRETKDRLAVYVHLLQRWNCRIRLTGLDFTAGRDPVDDSLHLRTLLPSMPSTALDIGSGNGLPAIPLSIAFGIPFTLVESDRRKAAFLREAARATACPVTVLAERIEDIPIVPYDLITARAFAPLSRLLTLAYPRQSTSTLCLFPKGANVAVELQEANLMWSFQATCHPARTGQVVAVSAIQRRA